MSKNVDKVIEQADNLIKQERYAEAWKLLLPHKAEENARKRLKWLKAKQEQLKLEKEIAPKPSFEIPGWIQRIPTLFKVIGGLLALLVVLVICSALGQATGFIPDATERAATKVAQAAATDAILTANALTATSTSSATNTITPSATSSPEPTVTASSSATATLTASATFTPTTTFTASPSPTITNTPSPRATNTLAPPTATYAIYDPADLSRLDDTERMLLAILEDTEGVDFVTLISILKNPEINYNALATTTL
jgi:hypothetical protein